MKSSLILPIIVIIFIFQSCKNEKREISFEKFKFSLPEEVGMNSDSLAKIESMVLEFAKAGKFPGAVTLIAKNGMIIYESEVGWSDSARTKPYRKDNLFRLASMTKPITCVATLQLVDKGLIKLSDPVSKYIPAFRETGVLNSFNSIDTTWTVKQPKNPITIHHLLTHTSGIPYFWSPTSYSFGPPNYIGIFKKLGDIPTITPSDTTRNLTESMNKLAKVPLAFEPGEKWEYGLNMDVLGKVIEVVSGMELDDYVRENISNPLGIKKMDYFFADSLAKDLVSMFWADANGKMVPAVPNPVFDLNYPVQDTQKYFAGGTGMTGTARDYYLFCQAMLNDGKLGETRILKPETAQMIHQDQLDTITYPWGSNRFGYGVDITDNHPIKPNGVYHWDGTFGTTFWIDPNNDLIVIQLRQTGGNIPALGEMNESLEKIVYGALKKN